MKRTEQITIGLAITASLALASGPYVPPRPHPQRGTIAASAKVAETPKKPKEVAQPANTVSRPVDRVDVVVGDKSGDQKKAPSAKK